MKISKSNGSEIHRLKEMKNIDEEQFNRLFKICQPIIRKLSYNINTKKYRVTRDILQSYFNDKFLYVYNKYHLLYDEDRLKYTLIRSLGLYRNKLLRNAYTEQGEFNEETDSFEDIYESGKEWIDDSEEFEYQENQRNKFHTFMKEHLTEDEYLLFITQLNPPPFLEERIRESHGRISIYSLIEFFEMPKTTRSSIIISEMRQHIDAALKLASETFNKKEGTR